MKAITRFHTFSARRAQKRLKEAVAEPENKGRAAR
jgi:hypothetical protein